MDLHLMTSRIFEKSGHHLGADVFVPSCRQNKRLGVKAERAQMLGTDRPDFHALGSN